MKSVISVKQIVISILLVIFSSALSAQFSEAGLKFGEVLDKVSKYYVDSVDENKLVEEVITDMLHDLDPHSTYISKEDVNAVQEQLDGGFEGIGITFNILKDTLFVINPISGGPSEKVGILPGDRIVLVDDENIAGVDMKSIDIQKRLKGKKGTKVKVSIKRKGVKGLIDFIIVRDKIPIYSVDAKYMIDSKTGYIKIARFSNTTLTEFREALDELKNEGMQNLVLDLSGNAGGYLFAAIKLADEFFGDRRLILYTQGEKNPRRNYYSSNNGRFTEGNIVVLIDELSASASEIVSGALQDWDRAVIVGRRSFGKGLVQARFPLNDGSELRLTIAKYYTPSGRLIQKPYDEGFEEYSKDLLNRFKGGEYVSADSIVFPDSLKYRTLIKNRIVYGGGGIMPDYFIPLDTADNTDYYRSLVRKGILNQFILSYLDKNRKSLERKYPDFQTYNTGFEVTKELSSSLVSYAEEEGLDYNEEQFGLSEDKINLLLKAYIARDLWDSTEFYQIFNKSNKSLDKAIEILEDKSKYEAKLQPTLISD